MNSKQNVKNANPWIGPHVVLFLDVLDQREAIRKLEHLPSSKLERDNYILALKNSKGKVNIVRDCVKKTFDSYLNAPINVPIEALTSDQRAAFMRCRNGPRSVCFQCFSDTIVVYMPLNAGDSHLCIREVYAALGVACTTMIMSLGAEIPLRGGLDIGVAFTLEENDLYGPAALEAYRLESEVSQYPRISVGRNVIEYLNTAKQFTDKNPVHISNRVDAETSLELMAIDIDGVTFVDFLGKKFYEVVGGDQNVCDAVSKGAKYAKEQHGRFVVSENHKLALRYARLRQYYETRESIWLEGKTDATRHPA